MSNAKKMLLSAAGNAGGAGLDITEVFSTYLYTGTGQSQAIVNGTDLDGEGGLVWLKRRDGAEAHYLYDTERGTSNGLFSNQTNANTSISNAVTSFNTNGFTLGTYDSVNSQDGHDYVSWSFRKAPKFFDIVTYTGTGSAKNISHNLGSVPGMIIVKQTNATNNWWVQHIAFGGSHRLQLNATDAAETTSSVWNNTDPTSTVFTVGAHTGTNASNGTYVAYLFAHNNNDGEFGPGADQDIIKCGSYTGNNSSSRPVDLGFEPQWVMIKNVTSAQRGSQPSNWLMYDVMRGMGSGGNTNEHLYANTTAAKDVDNYGPNPTPTGFIIGDDNSQANHNGDTYIYMAIRRGPLAPPEAATEVFDAIIQSGTNTQTITTGNTVDLAILRSSRTSVNQIYALDRMRGGNYLETTTPNAENSGLSDYYDWDSNTGVPIVDSLSSNQTIWWMWKRAPGYFDVVAYGGTGSNRTQAHNLGVVPEMIWVKCRSSAGRDWEVYHSGLGATKFLRLNTAEKEKTNSARWNNTTPTSSVFSLGSNDTVNGSSDTYIAYLFATLNGVSKVGSYTGTGSTLNIDCGFSNGARFVLIKRTNDTNEWTLFDTARGIVAGNDPYLYLSNTNAEVNAADFIDPYSAGFSLTGVSSLTNDNGDSYIFYAIA